MGCVYSVLKSFPPKDVLMRRIVAIHVGKASMSETIPERMIAINPEAELKRRLRRRNSNHTMRLLKSDRSPTQRAFERL